MVDIGSLPPEILILIATRYEERGDIMLDAEGRLVSSTSRASQALKLSMLQINRHYYKTVQILLYRQVCVGSIDSIGRLARTLSKEARLAEAVRAFIAYEGNWVRIRINDVGRALAIIFDRCPNIDTVALDWPISRWPAVDKEETSETVEKEESFQIAYRMPSSVRGLTLGSQDELCMPELSRQLSRLHIKLYADYDSARQFYRSPFDNLVRLDIDITDYDSDELSRLWSGTPRLAYLGVRCDCVPDNVVSALGEIKQQRSPAFLSEVWIMTCDYQFLDTFIEVLPASVTIFGLVMEWGQFSAARESKLRIGISVDLLHQADAPGLKELHLRGWQPNGSDSDLRSVCARRGIACHFSWSSEPYSMCVAASQLAAPF